MGKAATTKIFLDKYHPRSDGKCAVSIRVSFDRKQRYYPFKFKLTEEEFDKLFTQEFQRIKKYKGLSQELVLEEAKAQQIINDFGNRFSFTLFEKKFMRKVGDEKDVFALLEERTKQLEKDGRIGTSVMSSVASVSLKKFAGKEYLSFDDCNVEFLNKYKKWMLEVENNSTATLGMYLREVRTVYNESIADGVIPQELYPFGKGKNKFKIPTGKNVKKALSLAEVAKIYKYKPENRSEEKAKDFWMLSYISNGVNPKDIALWRNRDKDGDVIRFIRSKSKRANEDNPIIITVIVTPDVKRIINKWGNKSINPDDFIFPIFPKNSSAIEQYKLIQLFVRFINDNMKRIAKKLEIKANLTTYVARHSMATILRKSGKTDEFISELIGHSNVQTTKHYLDQFEDDAKRKAVAELTNFNKLEIAI